MKILLIIIRISRPNEEDIKKLIPDAVSKATLIINGVDRHIF